MKILLIITLFLLSIAEAKDAKQKLTLGLGVYTQSQAYKDVDNIILPSPVVFFDNGLFYMRWSRGGIYFYGDKSDDFSWGFSLTAQPRTYGYKASDSPYLAGMDERKTTIEGGLAFSAQKNDLYIEVMALTDILDRYESWLIKTEFGDKYSAGDFSFYPSIIVSYQSQDFTDYYYGVKANEVNLNLNRTAYTADAGFQIGAQTYIKYPLSDSWDILLNLRADLLPNSASDSPIIEKDFIYSGLASVIYTFEY
jgi:outer membrane protein